jgi:hypothetical protein
MSGKNESAKGDPKSQDAKAEESALDSEMEDLAKQYLDLWQDQMTALASDNDFVAAWRKMAEAMGFNPAAGGFGAPAGDPSALLRSMMAGMAPPAAKQEAGGDDGDEQPAADEGAAAGSAPPAAAPERGGHDLDLIARRLALLEERVAELESKPRAPRKRAARKTAKKKS